MGQLNELQIKAAQPRDKEYMLSDGEGLYLRVRPNGKVWIYRYPKADCQGNPCADDGALSINALEAHHIKDQRGMRLMSVPSERPADALY